MNKNKNIEILINIGKAIRKCYEKIIDIEIENSADKDKIIRNIFKTIATYREFEERYFLILEENCNDEKYLNELYRDVFDNYNLIDSSFTLNYMKNLDEDIEVRRIFEELDRRIQSETEFEESLDDNNDVSEINQIQLLESINEEFKFILKNLMEDEDIVRLVHMINRLIKENIFGNQLSKSELYKIIYDMFFTYRFLEEYLIKDYSILAIHFLDATTKMSCELGYNDEEVAICYDNIRIEKMLEIFEELSQKRNANHLLKVKLGYLFFDLYASTISNKKLVEVFHLIKDKTENSYNEQIFEARNQVFNTLHERYCDLILDYEIEEEELVNKEREEKLKNRANVYIKKS